MAQKGHTEVAVCDRYERRAPLLNLPLRDYLSSVLPGLADFPRNRVAELTPKASATSK
jgi:hypothetical protein